MFEIRIICEPTDAANAAQAVLGTVDVTSLRTVSTRDGQRTRLYITADHRRAHTECTLCDEDGNVEWFRPDGRTEYRPCTGVSYEALLAAGLVNGTTPRRTTGA
ncbi:hypothetical protein ACIP3D_29765 [Streptomyces longwoodensis]|uniref:hypothetical protein n=1 Tax=Streptomyces longwoodensis TaxID=68231 RepID=UPI0037F67D40